MEQTAVQYSDRIKLPYEFDVSKMLEEFKALTFGEFEYYSVIPLRAPAYTIDRTLPEPPPADDYADGSWTDWMDSPHMEKLPYIKSIVDMFRANTKVTLVRLLRLAPKAVVRAHTDPTLGLEIHKSVIRLTIPIVNNDKVIFYLNETPVPMKVGECWYLRLTDTHRIVNDGDDERINLTIDMIPNDWIRNIIAESDI